MTTRTRTAALVAAVALCWSAPAARAQVPAGPVALKNTTGHDIRLSDMVYTDAAGVERTLAKTRWNLKAGEFSWLTSNNEKIVATKVRLNLVTGAGTTTLTWVSKGLDANGYMACQLSADDLTQHYRILGKAAPAAPPPVVAFRPRAGPTDRQIENGVVKVVGAIVSHLVVKEIESDPNPTAGRQLAAGLARVARDEIVASAVADLFPQLTPAEATTVRQMVCLAFDGRLTPANLNEVQAREALVAQLRRANPNVATAAEIANFLYQVQRARR